MHLDDLTGIDPKKKAESLRCLNSLLTRRDRHGRPAPIITGYNWYDTTTNTDPSLTIYHIHETEEYKRAMFRDLVTFGYQEEELNQSVRTKAGVFLWNPRFEIRDNSGVLYPGLRIRDTILRQYINLDEYEKPLMNYTDQLNIGALVAEGMGWELNLQFQKDSTLIKLIELFTSKSRRPSCRTPANHTILDKDVTSPISSATVWPDAYETPVLLVGSYATAFESHLPQLVRVTKLVFTENSNEISFVIHNNLDKLRLTEEYSRLSKIGFKEELCLANRSFITEYVDKKR